MYCLVDNGNGTFTAADPQPTDYTSCTYLLAQPSELEAEVWQLTMDEAMTLMPFFALVLVMGFTFRALARALNINERYDNE